MKHAASTYNPDFYDRQRRRQSTWNVPRIITSYDETLDDHLVLPRGLLDTVTKLVGEAGSTIDTDDRRADGSLQGLTFNADPRLPSDPPSTTCCPTTWAPSPSLRQDRGRR